MGRTDFADQFRKIIRHKRIGYNLNDMRQSACLVINPITDDNSFATLFNCTPVNWASDYDGPDLLLQISSAVL